MYNTCAAHYWKHNGWYVNLMYKQSYIHGATKSTLHHLYLITCHFLFLSNCIWTKCCPWYFDSFKISYLQCSLNEHLDIIWQNQIQWSNKWINHKLIYIVDYSGLAYLYKLAGYVGLIQAGLYHVATPLCHAKNSFC